MEVELRGRYHAHDAGVLVVVVIVAAVVATAVALVLVLFRRGVIDPVAVRSSKGNVRAASSGL